LRTQVGAGAKIVDRHSAGLGTAAVGRVRSTAES
jgi:hypothetical protein